MISNVAVVVVVVVVVVVDVLLDILVYVYICMHMVSLCHTKTMTRRGGSIALDFMQYLVLKNKGC